MAGIQSWDGGVWGPLYEGCRQWAPRAGACGCLRPESWTSALVLVLVLLQGSWEGLRAPGHSAWPCWLGPDLSDLSTSARAPYIWQVLSLPKDTYLSRPNQSLTPFPWLHTLNPQ